MQNLSHYFLLQIACAWISVYNSIRRNIFGLSKKISRPLQIYTDHWKWLTWLWHHVILIQLDWRFDVVVVCRIFLDEKQGWNFWWSDRLDFFSSVWIFLAVRNSFRRFVFCERSEQKFGKISGCFEVKFCRSAGW